MTTNTAKELNLLVPVPKDVKTLANLFKARNKECYLVGGCVRDMFMNQEPHDYDLCTNATPEEIIQILKDNNIPALPLGIKYGTITAMIEKEGYEITTYRRESDYEDGRHPNEITFTTDIHKDLSRRDFSMNAIAYDPITEEIIDDYNGYSDIKNKILRCVGDANVRFKEDGLRILRALRFAIKYDFTIDIDTRASLLRNKDGLDKISKERITDEIRKILTCNKDIHRVFYAYHPIITTILPEIKECVGFEQNNKYHVHDVYNHILHVVDYCNTKDCPEEEAFVIKMAALLHDIGKPQSYVVDEEGRGHFYGHQDVSCEIGKQVFKNDFRLTTEQTEDILTLVKYHDTTVAETKASVKRALNKMGEKLFYEWLILRGADRKDHINLTPEKGPISDLTKLREIAEEIIAEKTCFQLKDLAINGNDLIQNFGFTQGKEIGDALRQLFEEVLDGKLENTKEALMDAAGQYVKRHKNIEDCNSPDFPEERE